MDAAAYVIAFEADVRDLESLAAPPAWAHLKSEAVRELARRLTIMKLGAAPSPEVLRLGDERWDAVGREFSEVMRARAGFWVGWPNLIRRSNG
jgi:hypothetical protein